MAEKGFDVQDLLAKHNTLLNIPPFYESKSTPLSHEDVISTQKIARLPIHVERVIAQVKNRFHILDGVVPMSLTGSINQIWTVCCQLTNFAGPILSNEDAGVALSSGE